MPYNEEAPGWVTDGPLVGIMQVEQTYLEAGTVTREGYGDEIRLMTAYSGSCSNPECTEAHVVAIVLTQEQAVFMAIKMMEFAQAIAVDSGGDVHMDPETGLIMMGVQLPGGLDMPGFGVPASDEVRDAGQQEESGQGGEG